MSRARVRLFTFSSVSHQPSEACFRVLVCLLCTSSVSQTTRGDTYSSIKRAIISELSAFIFLGSVAGYTFSRFRCYYYSYDLVTELCHLTAGAANGKGGIPPTNLGQTITIDQYYYYSSILRILTITIHQYSDF